MNISVGSISGGLAMPTVWRGPMVVNIRIFGDHFRQESFVDISGREISVAEVGSFVRVIELQLERLRDLIIWSGVRERFYASVLQPCDRPSLLPATPDI